MKKTMTYEYFSREFGRFEYYLEYEDFFKKKRVEPPVPKHSKDFDSIIEYFTKNKRRKNHKIRMVVIEVERPHFDVYRTQLTQKMESYFRKLGITELKFKS